MKFFSSEASYQKFQWEVATDIHFRTKCVILNGQLHDEEHNLGNNLAFECITSSFLDFIEALKSINILISNKIVTAFEKSSEIICAAGEKEQEIIRISYGVHFEFSLEGKLNGREISITLTSFNQFLNFAKQYGIQPIEKLEEILPSINQENKLLLFYPELVYKPSWCLVL